MDKYEIYLSKYDTFISDLEEILSNPDWRDELNDIAEDIFLAYLYRKELEKAPNRFFSKIRNLDLKLLSLGEELKALHPPAYNYFLKHFKWLIDFYRSTPMFLFEE